MTFPKSKKVNWDAFLVNEAVRASNSGEFESFGMLLAGSQLLGKYFD
jgi:hypothetical protein